MPSPYEFEFDPPNASHCDCCGGLSVRLTRYVYKEGETFAVYCAAYSNNHPDHELAMLISLGDWSDGSDRSQRVAFYCRVRPAEDSYQVMLGDAADSAWSDATIFGKLLSREEALANPLKATAFNVLDEAFLRDRSLFGFLDRVQCGDAAIPLEWSFKSPDVIASLAPDEKSRAVAQKNFAALDGSRFFVRCLLPLSVEHYGQWNVGVWLEFSRAQHDELLSAWDDPVRYPTIQLTARIANDIKRDLSLPVSLGDAVTIHVPHVDQPPHVKGSTESAITELLAKTWPQAEFEEYALSRGLL